ncbi:RAF-like serine/threonine-protein kinase 24 [Tasmannia lanceolata]|uniref:RAF-like serine/threonine-protein kinase 24 n=1 Tax=Tasmannia lanceolata TaxID=3420 RepID=UPI004064041B
MSGRKAAFLGPFREVQDEILIDSSRISKCCLDFATQSSMLRSLMCNRGIECLETSQPQTPLDQNQTVNMDSPMATNGGTDETLTPRVKFLCSFAGSILPRPQDGKLRYVGGDTRIVSLPRDVNYGELMSRMRELFEGASLLKYQQPDEDLDALVSVVNDDDVTNMMEEYDKLGSGDGFTRLRIFLFSNSDQDVSHFDTDERETERRYVDALNSLGDSPEFRKQQYEVPPPQGDKIHVSEQFFNPISHEVGQQNQQNCEVSLSLPPYNLRHLSIPHQSLGQPQHQQLNVQRCNEMEAPWSPAYYSPVHLTPHDPRTVPEFPLSPSTGRNRMPFGDFHDKCLERMSEEYRRQPVNHQPSFVDNVVWLPPGAISGDKAGFPGNLAHSHNVFEGNSICEHCRMAFQRNPVMPEARYPDSRWRHGPPHMDQLSSGNEFPQFPNPCVEFFPGRETYVLNPDMKLDHGMYSKEQSELYNESHNHERGWVLHHQSNHRAEEPRTHVSGAGRVNEHYLVDGSGMNFSLVHGNCCDGHTLSYNCINHDDPRYVRAGTELGNEGFHNQTVGAGPHMHVPALEDSGICYKNLPYAYGMDNVYQVPHGSTSLHALQRKAQNSLRGSPSYEASGLLPQANGTVNTGLIRVTQEGSPRFAHVGVEDQNPWAGHCVVPSQKTFRFDGSAVLECSHSQMPKLNLSVLDQENQNSFAPESIQRHPEMLPWAIPAEAMPLISSFSNLIDDKMVASTVSGLSPTSEVNAVKKLVEEKTILRDNCEVKHVEMVKDQDVQNILSPAKESETLFYSNGVPPCEDSGDATELAGTANHGACENGELSVQDLSFLPELIASVKKAALEGAEVVKARVHANVDADLSPNPVKKEPSMHELESVRTHMELEPDSESDQPTISKIEQTMAETEALARGLQTIKNEDLEEIKELGSGTYGAVYHGKWKGSDVAIKRIKASCFSGRPSERERLIADFWKEALILSSLHHPNVVSFYGIVRDGPDGTLATVTEFMVNGSLKQFLQKKDRTIDRRKRLILAMDAAFGMEYLHGKNIVHFDLKCGNLLVNMRDPHRPVCKIGDLGLSKVKQHTLVSGGVRGTLLWMAPELLSGKSNMVTEKIDVYSFGIVMWELLTGEEPYTDMRCASIIGGIVNNTLRPQVPTWCDPEWKFLMESCWSSDPGERPSFSEISQKLRKMSAAINVK